MLLRFFWFFHITLSNCLMFYQSPVPPSLDFLAKAEKMVVVVENIDSGNSRLKRSLNTGRDHPAVRVSFQAFGQNVSLILNNQHLFVNDPTVFVQKTKSSSVKSVLNTENYLQGHLEGDDNSYAHGQLLSSGKFDGAVVSPLLNDSIYIEPANRYYDDESVNNSLIYRLSDLNQTYIEMIRQHTPGIHASKDRLIFNQKNRFFEKSQRMKRQDRGAEEFLRSPERLRSMHCPLHVFADHRYFEDVGRGNIAGTIAEIIFHIGQADAVFRSTSFDNQGTGSNIGFSIAKITLFKTEESNPLAYVKNGDDAQEYLTGFTAIDHSDYCLGVAFTVVDFSEGVLGLAWIADPKRKDSGICALPHKFRNGSYACFNTAIISMMNFEALVSRPMFAITVAHELAHNFGSEHDTADTYSCAPGGSDGNYIMFHVSGDGMKPNHFMFSSCSINYMYNVLLVRMDMCFQASLLSYCSNAIIDKKQEECDCGTESTCEEFDPCCNVYEHNSTTQCKLKSSAKCSPVASVCCSDTCDITPASEQRLCVSGSECQAVTHCDGISSECPPPTNLPDGTLCQQNIRVCLRGECAESVCKFHGLDDCYCSDAEFDCHLCCRNTENDECKPAYTFDIEAGANGKIPVNGLCLDGKGICDEDGICLFLDGTFAKTDISKLVKQTATKALEVITNYWYFVLLGVSAAVGVSIMFIFIHKNKKPDHSIAYRDGRMARVWFEARERLVQVEEEIEDLEAHSPPETSPFIVASRRLAFQFPTVPAAMYNQLTMRCGNEKEVVKMLLIMGYPMRKLITDHETAEED